MDFNRPEFLFVFLPLFLCLFLLVNVSHKKWLILLASALFYYLYQKEYFLLILVIGIFNYLVIVLLGRIEHKQALRRLVFWFAILSNISLLLFFKLASTQSTALINLFTSTGVLKLFLTRPFPLGLSFITFSVVSCLIDSYNSRETAPKGLFSYFQYLLFFPKVVVGPIVRFTAFEAQLTRLPFSWERFAKGSKRFIIGITKKVAIADQLAVIVNAGFALEKPAFPTSIAWTLLIAFALQIYYDFSGYIDMGIGIAQIIGFDLPENFNLPYLSKSVTEFWRRWHITLATWFRNYVFYPLEFKRRKSKFLRIETNTMIVFLLTGLWHGVTLNFIIWGLVQGFAIVFENSRFGQWIKKLPEFAQHIYFIGMVLFGWVFFRSPTVEYALRFFKRLIIVDQNIQMYPYSVSQPLPIINNSIYLIMVVGIIGLFPFTKLITSSFLSKIRDSGIGQYAIDIGYIALLILAIALGVSQNFVPSIYGKF